MKTRKTEFNLFCKENNVKRLRKLKPRDLERSLVLEV